MFNVLRQRNFALLWIGQLISSLGDWILWIALPFYVYEQTGSALAAGTLFMMSTLPPILFGSLAGVFVDRWDRKWTMVVADLSRTLLLLPLLIDDPAWLWIVYPIIFGSSAISQFFAPAKSAMIPIIVGKPDLMAANTLNSLSDNLTMLVGPALAGTLIGILGMTNVILLDAASFVLSGLLISSIALPSTGARRRGIDLADDETKPVFHPGIATVRSATKEWVRGIQLIRSDHQILAIFTVKSIAMLGQGIIRVLWVIFVAEILGGGPLEYGWVQVAVAAGGLLGALLIGRRGQIVAPGRLIAFSGMAIGLLLLATYNLPRLPVILVLQFLVGIPSVGFFVTMQTLLQMGADEHYLGRVFGMYNTTSALMVLVGQGVAGLVGDDLGLVPVLDASAGLYFLSGVVALIALSTRANLPEPSVPEPE